jgi:S-formylglutathione hydrolase FrmB
VSGRWLDFITTELVPFIDNKFRTLRHRDSRAVASHFMGGRGALKLAMTHSEIFSVVYALHPVATGNGYMPWVNLQMDWKKIYSAKTFDEVDSKIFVAVSQAFLPNLNRPPFYCDFFRDHINGEFKLNINNVNKAKAGFHLEETLEESATNLKTMRGIAFDWARFDSNQDHVYANQTFSRKLKDQGVEHEAEEYNGDPWSQNWTENGRVYSRMLPFLARHLVFDANK